MICSNNQRFLGQNFFPLQKNIALAIFFFFWMNKQLLSFDVIQMLLFEIRKIFHDAKWCLSGWFRPSKRYILFWTKKNYVPKNYFLDSIPKNLLGVLGYWDTRWDSPYPSHLYFLLFGPLHFLTNNKKNSLLINVGRVLDLSLCQSTKRKAEESCDI